MIHKLLSLLIGAALLLSAGVAAAREPISEPLTIHSSGLLDEDGTALYSVLVASGTDDLTGVTITAQVPEGAAFIEAIWTPEAAEFTGEAAGTVTWTVPELAADTVIGPFTFRAAFADDEAEMPLNVAATAVAGDVTAEVAVRASLPYPYTTQLTPRAESASITVDAAGTEVAQPVGETGGWILVPEGAVDAETTLTVTLLPFEGLPDDDTTWWCSLVRIEADEDITLPVTLLLPTRRTLTPGLPVSLFAQAEDGMWTDVTESGVLPLAEDDPLAELGSSFVAGDGNFLVVRRFALLSAGTLTLAAGVDDGARRIAEVKINESTGSLRQFRDETGYIEKIII